MHRVNLVIFLFLVVNLISSQEKDPVYVGCENISINALNSCFNTKIQTAVVKEFNIPEIIKKDNFKGQIKIVFVVNKKGEIKVLHVKSPYKILEKEVLRVFATLPIIKPATYNGRAIAMRYVLPLSIPLTLNKKNNHLKNKVTKNKINRIQIVVNKNYSNVNLFPEDHSELNIPFTHQFYNYLDYNYNLSSNSHTSFKPYLYNDVKKYVDLDAQKKALLLAKTSWLGKKLFNEHMVNIQNKDYWFTLDPGADLQLGKDNSDLNYTYNNTRALLIQGGLGKNLNFSTSIFESQGRFADYINNFILTNKPSSGEGLVPGRGKAKDFRTNGFDYPVAEGYLSYTPNKFFNFQFGNGKNFIGDGYRSLLLSDISTPYPYLKITTSFWKIRYTNLWMWISDVRKENLSNGVHARKYAAIHYLDINITKRLNLGLFESVITDNANGTGADINFFNPVIFYRNVEFSRGQKGGNALLGLTTKYKFTNNIIGYSQLLLDELSFGSITQKGNWKNKYALQLGAKYYNAFKIKNLYLQTELNIVRPFTYSHRNPLLNYGHYNQPLAHPWGGNFWEAIGIAQYKKNRWFANAKINFGKKGFDFANSTVSYGGDIYKSYTLRNSDTGFSIADGNTVNIFIGNLQVGYLVNPATNLQLFGGFIYRRFQPTNPTSDFASQNTTWFSFGLRTNLFNWYFDF